MFSDNDCQSSATHSNNVGHNARETRCSSNHTSNVAVQREHIVLSDGDIRTHVDNESMADIDSDENQAGDDEDTF
tara:strand:- start:7036 stop:7260 length:225 start_codon:yes stop_codon:yes gene_type:complete